MSEHSAPEARRIAPSRRSVSYYGKSENQGRSAMPDPITFMTRLTDAEWDPVVGGWTCPVLQIPGAVVEGIYVEGSQIDSGKFQVLQGQHIIRWMPPEKPPRIAVIISLTQELALGSETDKWRRRAIILPFAATVASALITAIPTYWSKRLSRNSGKGLESRQIRGI
jgi:hypothetical protein